MRKAVKATIPHKTPNLIISALACLLGQNEDFLKKFTEFEKYKELSSTDQHHLTRITVTFFSTSIRMSVKTISNLNDNR